MAIHMVVDVEGTEYRLTLSRDDAGNYVADAARHGGGDPGAAAFVPLVRVVDSAKERAMEALLDSLRRLRTDRRAGGGVPAAHAI